MVGQGNDLPDTQVATQSQTSQIWQDIQSQPVQNAWGRLLPKNLQIKSLGTMNTRPIYVIKESSHIFDIFGEKFSVGRGENNDLMLTVEHLPEKHLSRISKTHFTMTRDLNDPSNPVYIQDLSRNGTFVNGEKIGSNNSRILSNDDVISLSHPQNKVFVFKDLNPYDTRGLPSEILSKYFISRVLGNGACGVVRLIYNRHSCQKYAMKHVKKYSLLEHSQKNIFNDPKRIINEVDIMKNLQHPCVIKMHDIVNTPESVFMILEYMKGGDLLSRIVSKKGLSEKMSKFYFYQMCHAVKYLHDKGITHRDLKPDNILLETDDEETLLKVSDFGLSKFVRNNSVMRTLCGTPLYVAPEILITGGKESYTKKVDIWSLGVVLFSCLSGTLPFSDDYGTLATEQIKKGDFNFLHPIWKNISYQAKSLITKMLTVNPNRRPSIDYILRHKWLQDEEIIEKAHTIMKITLPVINQNSNSDDENFLEPPIKRARRR